MSYIELKYAAGGGGEGIYQENCGIHFSPRFFYGKGSVILHILQRVGAEISSVCLRKKGGKRSSNAACEIFLALARN